MSKDLEAFVNKVQAEAPRSEVKGVDYLAIAEMVMKFIELIVKFWQDHKKKNPTPAGLQADMKNLGFIKRLLLKNAVKQQFGKTAWKDGVFQKTLDNVIKSDYNSLSTIVNDDLKLSVKI